MLETIKYGIVLLIFCGTVPPNLTREWGKSVDTTWIYGDVRKVIMDQSHHAWYSQVWNNPVKLLWDRSTQFDTGWSTYELSKSSLQWLLLKIFVHKALLWALTWGFFSPWTTLVNHHWSVTYTTFQQIWTKAVGVSFLTFTELENDLSWPQMTFTTRVKIS